MQNQTDTRHIDTSTGEILDAKVTGITDMNVFEGELDNTVLDEAMITALAEGQALEAKIHEQNGRIEMQLQQRGEATGASVIYGKDFKYVISTKHETDWANMPPVLEYLTPDEKTEAYKPEHTISVPTVPEYVVPEVPEHDEVVPAKWAVVGTIKKLAGRHGAEALAAVSQFPAKVSGKLEEVT